MNSESGDKSLKTYSNSMKKQQTNYKLPIAVLDLKTNNFINYD